MTSSTLIITLRIATSTLALCSLATTLAACGTPLSEEEPTPSPTVSTAPAPVATLSTTIPLLNPAEPAATDLESRPEVQLVRNYNLAQAWANNIQDLHISQFIDTITPEYFETQTQWPLDRFYPGPVPMTPIDITDNHDGTVSVATCELSYSMWAFDHDAGYRNSFAGVSNPLIIVVFVLQDASYPQKGSVSDSTPADVASLRVADVRGSDRFSSTRDCAGKNVSATSQFFQNWRNLGIMYSTGNWAKKGDAFDQLLQDIDKTTGLNH